MNTRTGNPPPTVTHVQDDFGNWATYIVTGDPRDQPVPNVTGSPEVGPSVTITRRKYTVLLLVLGTLTAVLAGIGTAVGSAIIVSLIEGNPL